MPSRHGRYCAALGGLILTLAFAPALAQQVEQGPEKQRIAADARATGQSHAPPARVGIVPQQQATEADAAAPQQGEEGVELGSWPDWVIVIFTGVLVWLSWRQHKLETRLARETGDSLKIAKQSADAATQTAAASQQMAAHAFATARAQLRPWVTLRSVAISNIAEPTGHPHPPTGAEVTNPNKGPYVGFEFVNIGPTPALDCEVWYAISFQEFPLSRRLPRHKPTTHPSRSAILPGVVIQKALELPTPLTGAEISGLRDATRAVYFYGWVKYADIYGERHITRFRLFHNRHSGEIGLCTAMTHYGRGNKVT